MWERVQPVSKCCCRKTYSLTTLMKRCWRGGGHQATCYLAIKISLLHNNNNKAQHTSNPGRNCVSHRISVTNWHNLDTFLNVKNVNSKYLQMFLTFVFSYIHNIKRTHENWRQVFSLSKNYLNLGLAGSGTTLFVVWGSLAPTDDGMLYTLSRFSTWSSSLGDPRSATNLITKKYIFLLCWQRLDEKSPLSCL